MQWLGVIAVGIGVGFFAGMFGKGGSAIATPPPYPGFPRDRGRGLAAPATIPSTLAASWAYWRKDFIVNRVMWWSLAFGIPATLAGAAATRWVSGELLVKVTDVIVAGLGVRFVLRPGSQREDSREVGAYRLRMALVATVVGAASRLLANSGGFLLVPLYLTILRLPIKDSFATSLAVAAVLAVPGTVVHWALGHIDWTLVLVFGAASVPLSHLGAKVALRSNPVKLERIYGFALVGLGAAFFFIC